MAHLPPIQTLPVFEASARLLSFKKAGEELCITSSAVSQQIKSLEDALDVSLFERKHRSLSLTPAGTFYYSMAEKVMRTYRQGHHDLKNRFQRKLIRLSMPSVIALDLVLPNTSSLQQAMNGDEVRFEIADTVIDLELEQVDAAIRSGQGNWPRLHARHLSDFKIAIACAPSYLEKNPIDDLKDLINHQLLEFSGWPTSWSWFFEEYCQETPALNVLSFDNGKSQLEAAIAGMGVTMGTLEMILPGVKSGDLLIPLDFIVNTPFHYGYHFVSVRDIDEDESLLRCYEWLSALFKENMPNLP